MKKQTQRKNGSIALLGALVLTLLGLGSCANPLQGPNEKSPATGVRISIVTGGERTLLPQGEFSNYKLHFSTNDSVPIPEDITTKLTDTVVPLTPATWDITVTAYVYLDGDYKEAATGTARVSLAAEELKGVSIRVSANLAGENGSFSYAVSYPENVISGVWELSKSGTTISGDLLDQPEDDKIPLPPGYYRLRAAMETSYGMAVRTEVVQIYPGLETRWDHAFVEADFGVPIEISGTVDLKGLGTVEAAQIALFQDSGFSWSSMEAYRFEENPSDTWSWTIRVLPFNRPTDLYVGLWLVFPNGDILTHLLPVPLSVYDQNLPVSDSTRLGPFKARHFTLSGLVDPDGLDPSYLSLITGASVYIYKDNAIPEEIGIGAVNLGDGSWSLDLFAEQALPVRIVLKLDTTIGSVYDEIKRPLPGNQTGNLAGLNFAPKMISAGTVITGTAADSYYSYLFTPDTSGNHVFTASSNDGPISGLSVYGDGTWLATAGADATLPLSLTSGVIYSIRLDLGSPSQTFQLRVDPAAQATLGGTVDFAGLLSSFDSEANVTVSSAALSVYADNKDHQLLGTGTVNIAEGSWTATAGFAGVSNPAVLALSAILSNGQTVLYQEYLSISGDHDALNLAPAALKGQTLAGQSPVFRTTVNNADQLLYVPAETGLYSLSAVSDDGYVVINDLAGTVASLPDANINGSEVVVTLTGGEPYLVAARSPYSAFAAYQFQARKLPPVTLSGTFNFAGLALPGEDIGDTEIQVYDYYSNLAQLESPVMVDGGSWTALMPPASTDRPVRIAATVHLKNGGQIDDALYTLLARSTAETGSRAENLNFAPVSITSGVWSGPVNVYAGGNGVWLLWIPETAGEYVLDVERYGNMDPRMSLYDGAGSINPIESNDDHGGSLNSRIHRTDFVAGRPYLVQVEEAHNGAGTFRFRALPRVTLSGTVNFDGLAPLTGADISSTEITVYAAGPNPAQLASATAGNDGAWTLTLPPALTGQTVSIAATAHLKNNGQISGYTSAVISAGAVTVPYLDLALAPIADGESSHPVYAGSAAWLLWIPEITDYLLEAEKIEGNMDPQITLYRYSSNSIGNPIAAAQGKYTLTAEQPYLVRVRDANNGSGSFKFKAIPLPPVTLSGNVSLTGLTALAPGINRTEIQVYDAAGGSSLGSQILAGNTGGSWTLILPPVPADRTVRIEAVVYLNNGRQINNSRVEAIARGADSASNLNFAPVAVTSGTWHSGTVYGGDGTWMLWIPSAGSYTLDAEQTDGNMDPHLYLYNALTGEQLAENDNTGGYNSRIQCNVVIGQPYLVRVKDHQNRPGAFRFRATPL